MRGQGEGNQKARKGQEFLWLLGRTCCSEEPMICQPVSEWNLSLPPRDLSCRYIFHLAFHGILNRPLQDKLCVPLCFLFIVNAIVPFIEKKTFYGTWSTFLLLTTNVLFVLKAIHPKLNIEISESNWRYNFVQLPINRELKALEQRIGQTLQSERRGHLLYHINEDISHGRKEVRKWIGIIVTLPRSFNFVFSCLTKFVTEQVDDIGCVCVAAGNLTITMI